MTVRVGVLGAGGRMGRTVCAAIAAADDLELTAAVDPSFAGEPLRALAGPDVPDLRVEKDPRPLTSEVGRIDVAVDFTRPDAVMGNVRALARAAVHAVVGTTGVRPTDLEEIRALLGEEPRSNVLVVPNFAIGAVLMQRFAEEAARYLPAAEIVELHHDGKLDAPSGTAAATAERIAAARGETPASPGGGAARGGEVAGVRVHSVRLPGLVAHQEVIFGGPGQTLTIRHDSMSRESFMPGVLLAIRRVPSLHGLVVGLEALLE